MKINNIQDIVRPSGSVVFVTGVTGQDGSHMVDYLLKKTDLSVIGGARRLSVDNHINLKHLENEPRFQLVNFDLTDSHSIYKIIEVAKPDYFINFAAQSFVASSWDFALQTLETNVVGVVNCLEAIKHSRPSCRFYNAGSSEEFGNVAYEPQDENHPERPRSPYGASKVSARQYVKVYRESYGLYAVQGWLFNHEGPRRGEEFVTRKITKGVARIFKAVVNNEKYAPIELGNLDAERDWSDAEDMMDAVWRMLNQEKYGPLKEKYNKIYKETHDRIEKLNGEPYIDGNNEFAERPWKKLIVQNIKDYVVGSGKRHTIREFVEKAFELSGIKGGWIASGVNEEYVYLSGPCSFEEPVVLVKVNPKFYRPAEVEKLRADPSKIKEELGWKPKTTFEGLVDKMITNDLTLVDDRV